MGKESREPCCLVCLCSFLSSSVLPTLTTSHLDSKVRVSVVPTLPQDDPLVDLGPWHRGWKTLAVPHPRPSANPHDRSLFFVSRISPSPKQ